MCLVRIGCGVPLVPQIQSQTLQRNAIRFLYTEISIHYFRKIMQRKAQRLNDLEDLTAPRTNGRGAGHIVCSVHDGKCKF